MVKCLPNKRKSELILIEIPVTKSVLFLSQDLQSRMFRGAFFKLIHFIQIYRDLN